MEVIEYGIRRALGVGWGGGKANGHESEEALNKSVSYFNSKLYLKQLA
jgi:hypothetical protein